jgi:hypothetical protein
LNKGIRKSALHTALMAFSWYRVLLVCKHCITAHAQLLQYQAHTQVRACVKKGCTADARHRMRHKQSTTYRYWSAVYLIASSPTIKTAQTTAHLKVYNSAQYLEARSG